MGQHEQGAEGLFGLNNYRNDGGTPRLVECLLLPSRARLLAAVTLALGISLPLSAQCEFTEDQKFVPADSAPGDIYGGAVGISGDWLFNMSEWDDINGTNSGSAYIYHWNGTSWDFTQKIDLNDGAIGDNFGRGVAIDGNVMVIGAWRDDTGGLDAGCAYVFRYNGSSWVQEQKLTASDAQPSDNFGFTVAIDSGVILAGAHMDDGVAASTGSAYVFRFNGSSWVEEQKLTISDSVQENRVGFAVVLEGDTAVISAHNAFTGPLLTPGAGYVFRRVSGVWTEEQKLIASDGVDGDVLSFHLDLDANRVVLGAWRANAEAGTAYFYDIARNDFNDDNIPDECQSFWADVETISLLSGGTQSFNLDAGVANAGSFYRVFGTFTGTTPGLDFGFGNILPLNYDDYFKITLNQPGLSPFFAGYKGFLSASGTAVASFHVPGPFDPSLAGVLFHHAFVSAEVVGFIDFASNAIPVMLVP